MRHHIWLLAAAILAASPLAAATTWKLDRAHSSVNFSVAHLVISQVSGTFKDFDVRFTNTKEDFSDATLSAEIRAGSIFTDNDRRDAHLKSADFLDAERYPAITFRSRSFTKTGDNTFRIEGDLTIRDVTKPVVLDGVYKGQVSAWGKTVIAFSATTEINRFDFGVKWDAKMDAGGLIAGDKVKIDISFEGQKE
ncbi:MAG TPA: YceI family protein [Bacteroidota bacterium]|nr:YceI family protein [Bacteroidota bacterium]